MVVTPSSVDVPIIIKAKQGFKPISSPTRVDDVGSEPSSVLDAGFLVRSDLSENLKQSTECGRESVKMAPMDDLPTRSSVSSTVCVTVVPSDFLVSDIASKGCLAIV